MSNSRDDFTNEHLRGTILTAKKQIEIAAPVMMVSFVLVIASLISFLLKRKFLNVGPQFVAMILGILVVLTIGWIDHPAIMPINYMFVDPYKVLSFHYPLITLKFVYLLDTSAFTKYVYHLLLICVMGWCIFVVCFGFLLITFAGEVSSLSMTQLLFAGIIFAPIEVPNVALNIDRFKLAELVLLSESLISSMLSSMSIPVIFGAMDHIFDHWYQPIMVILRQFTLAIIFGGSFGLIGGKIFSKTCTNSTHTTLSLATAVYVMYHFCQYILGCDAGLGCFLFVFFISRKRIDIPKDIDKEIVTLIEIIYTCMSIVLNFMAVVITFPYFLKWFDVMGAAIAAALYICANVLRFVFFLIMSPLTSRLGQRYTFKTLVCMVWCVRKGPLTFIMLTMTVVEGFDKVASLRLLHFGLNYLLLMNALNDVSAWTMLKKMSFTGDDSFKKQENFKDALSYIKEKKNVQLSIMRMNRFYSDANWKVIQDATTICQSVKSEDAVGMDENGLRFHRKIPYCEICKTSIVFAPSKKEYDENLNEIKLRLLHAMKVSFVCQYERGCIEDATLQALYHLYDTSVNSKNLTLVIDDLLQELKAKERLKFGDKARMALHSSSRKEMRDRYIPRFQKPFRIMHNWAFVRFIDTITAAQFAVVLIIILNDTVIMEIFNVMIISLFVVEFFIKWFGSVNLTYKDGFKRYIKSLWHKFEFVLLILGIIDLMCSLTELCFSTSPLYKSQRLLKLLVTIMRLMRLLQLARIVFIYRIFKRFHLAFVLAYDKRVDSRVGHVYSIGRAVVISYEEVDDLLESVTSDHMVIDLLRAQLEEDKNKIARELGMIERDRPWVTTRVKTRQAMMCTMKTVSNAVHQLADAGMIDSHEYWKIQRVLTERWKAILPMKKTPMTTPKSLFYEVSWIARDDTVFEYLYENVSLKVWDVGDVIVSRGDVDIGILIIISGMCKMTYTPDSDTLYLLRNNGLLPIKDLIQHSRFSTPSVEYIFKGNSIGELSAMTDRPYCCDIVAETPCQAYIISPKVIDEALKTSCDPVNGLYSRIWVHISNNFIRRLLLKTHLFSKMTSDQLDAILVRSFVPRMQMFLVFYLNPLIEDVVVIEGTVVDYESREIYIGPCYIPRGISKLMIPSIVGENKPERTIPKLLIIPMKDVDQYEVMMYCELTSELNPNTPSIYFLRTNFYRKWQKHKKQRLFGVRSNRSFSSNTGLSIHKMLFQSADRSAANIINGFSTQEILEMLHTEKGGVSMRSITVKDTNQSSVAKFWNPTRSTERSDPDRESFERRGTRSTFEIEEDASSTINKYKF